MLNCGDRIGYWERRDIRSLTLLIGGFRFAAARIPDAAKTRAALRVHPIYRWLKEHMPDALARTRADENLSDIRMVQVLVRGLVIAWGLPAAPATEGRPDKRRKAAYSALESVEEYLYDATICLDNQEDQATLRDLVARAKNELRRPRPKSVANEGLFAIATGLHQELGIADAKLLADIASAAGLICDLRTAQRYMKDAARR